MSQQRPVIQNTQRKMDVSKSSEDHILYYSNYCINCKEFMNILCKTPMLVRELYLFHPLLKEFQL